MKPTVFASTGQPTDPDLEPCDQVMLDLGTQVVQGILEPLDAFAEHQKLRKDVAASLIASAAVNVIRFNCSYSHEETIALLTKIANGINEMSQTMPLGRFSPTTSTAH